MTADRSAAIAIVKSVVVSVGGGALDATDKIFPAPTGRDGRHYHCLPTPGPKRGDAHVPAAALSKIRVAQLRLHDCGQGVYIVHGTGLLLTTCTLCDLLDAPTALAACCGFDLCHKYILYLYLYLHTHKG